MLGAILNLVFVAFEAVYGFVTNSVALIADAGHNLGDVLALLLAWIATWLVRQRPTARHTYGFRKSSILTALANSVALFIAVGAIAAESLRRLWSPEPVASDTVLWVAALGIAVNLGTAWLFAAGRHAELNARGAFLHMASDAGLSFAVVLAALGIRMTGWMWLDPAASLLLVAVITVTTWSLLRQSFGLAIDAVPRGIDAEEVRARLAALPGVDEVHDLHIWPLSTTETALTCHLVIPEGHPGDAVLMEIGRLLSRQFGINHTTVQIETGSGPACVLAPEEVI